MGWTGARPPGFAEGFGHADAARICLTSLRNFNLASEFHLGRLASTPGPLRVSHIMPTCPGGRSCPYFTSWYLPQADGWLPLPRHDPVA